MTQEEKQLLLIDLCSRLPYKVMGHATWTYLETDREVKYAEKDRPIEVNDLYAIWDFKPYLRPLCSMTSEEKEELKTLKFIYSDGHITNESIEFDEEHNILVDEVHCSSVIDWLNAHHFDYRNLIKMGLALDAPQKMYEH